MYRLWFASRRQMAALYAAIYFAVVGLVLLFVATSLGAPGGFFAEFWPWIVGLTVAALIFAVLASKLNGSVFARYAATIDHLDPQQRGEAYKASLRGPVPTDPAVRDAARRICQRYLDDSKGRSRIWIAGVVVLAFLAILQLVIGDSADSRPLFALVAVLAAALAVDFHSERRNRRRSEILSAPAGSE